VDIELGPVDRITADAVGPAGQRTFFIQARKDDRIVTVLLEKQQVQLLAASVVEILAQIGKPTGEGPPEEAMGLEEPVIPEWRVGRLAISYVEEQDVIMLEADELVPGAEDEEDDEEDEDTDDAEDEDGELGGPGDLGEHDGPTLPELQSELGFDPDAPDEGAPEPGHVRFWATREQMLALARHGAQVCSQGRPTCRYCDQPLDPEGHICPAMNGHRAADDA
jgi:uncharacterized repeat protein (TIGR03847 family)